MSNLRANLNNLKSKLQNIEASLNEENKRIIQEGKLQADLGERINDITSNKEKVTINVGGKIFTTFKSTLMKDHWCILAVLIKEYEDSYRPLPQEFFFDRRPEYFEILLNYLRTGRIKYNNFSETMLKQLYIEAEFYEVSDVREYLYEKCKEIEVVSFKFGGEYIHKGQVAGTNTIEGLKDNTQMKGICSKAPGEIEFELNGVFEISNMQIGGYKGNPSLWYPGNGSGAKISVSENGTTWEKVGTIPSKFAKEIVTVDLKKVYRVKHVKFEIKSFLGIGYFNIPRDIVL
jgi:hypothetical protein